jgi:DNA-binding LacI/PurR family transcriptional regulator
MQKYALISSIDNLSVGKLRADGYLKALENNGIAINSNIIIRTDSEELTGKIEKYFEPNRRNLALKRTTRLLHYVWP